MKSLLLISALVASFSASATSFDCGKASTFVEKEICTNLLLSKLDDALSRNYQLMMASDIGADSRLEQKAVQKRWLQTRNRCTDYTCIEQAYRPRIDEICEYPVISGIHPDCTVAETID
jgi:uncharacterized protein